MEVAGCNCYVDYIVEDGNYMTMAIDMRNYTGPRCESAKGAEVMLVALDEVHDVFDKDSDRNVGAPYTWVDYCRYINTNTMN